MYTILFRIQIVHDLLQLPQFKENELQCFDEFLPPKSADSLRSLLSKMASKEEEEAEIFERCLSGAPTEHLLSAKKKIKSSSTVRDILSAMQTTSDSLKIGEKQEHTDEVKSSGDADETGAAQGVVAQRPETAGTVDIEQNDDGESLSDEPEPEVVKPPRTYNNNKVGRRISRELVLTHVQNKQSGFNQNNKNTKAAEKPAEEAKEEESKKRDDVIETVPEEGDDVFHDDVMDREDLVQSESEFGADDSDEEEEPLDPKLLEVRMIRTELLVLKQKQFDRTIFLFLQAMFECVWEGDIDLLDDLLDLPGADINQTWVHELT